MSTPGRVSVSSSRPGTAAEVVWLFGLGQVSAGLGEISLTPLITDGGLNALFLVKSLASMHRVV